ncbi:CRISPR-associated protein [Pyrobaculum aerophilum]|uniref:CRISPR-associated protein n=1 Tax=Pyrobaculum aerophilum TaxID=13773 RepID=A0A371R537_9CREN|nr:CRISPR-associated protein [Pyrobaculum aerophilum]RFA93080.1 CRISPR-associated protein [Pyrobaculum aerophilum]RFA99174.1 CRISPR-associated protein [Pyrobaculum aerophilum]
MKYYTPGHGLVTDSLIMHGFVKLLHVSGRISGKVRKLGERFEIEAEEVDWGKFNNWELHEFVKQAVDHNIDLGPMADLRRSAIDISGFLTWKKKLKETLVILPKEFDLSPNHAERFREGRKRGRGYTLYLPISLAFGKYAVSGYAVSDTPYVVCPSCFALSTLGYIYGAVRIRVDLNEGFTIYNIAGVPADEADLLDMISLQRMAGLVRIGKREKTGRGINALGALVYALSVGETILAVDSPIDLIVWRTERSGNNQRAMAEGVYRGRRLLEAMAMLKLYYPKWPRIVRRLEGNVLNILGEFLVFGGDAYGVVREIVKNLKSGKDKEKTQPVEVDAVAKVILKLQR